VRRIGRQFDGTGNNQQKEGDHMHGRRVAPTDPSFSPPVLLTLVKHTVEKSDLVYR
jgi:hypothetical protein